MLIRARHKLLLALSFALLGLDPLYAKPVRFDLRDAGLRNLVYFISEGTLQKTVALSHAAGGWLELDPQALTDGVKGQLEVDVRTFETGNDAINVELRRRLSSSEFPLAVFVPTRVSNASKAAAADGQPVTLKLEGNLTLHGITKPETWLVKLTYFRESESTRQRLPGNLLKVSANLELDLTRYDMAVPEDRSSQFSRYLQGWVDAVGTDQPPTAQIAGAPGAAPQKPKEKDKEKK